MQPQRMATIVASLFSLNLAVAAEPETAPIVVTATRQPQRINELLADVTVIDREAIEAAGHSTVTELLGRQPGIQAVATGGPGASVSLFVRGTNSNHVLVLVDGIRFGSATNGQPMLESLPLSQVERIEILRGPSSSLYGPDAIGGVIQIFTRRGAAGAPRIDAFAGAGSQRTAEAVAGIAGGIGDLTYSLRAGRYQTRGFDALKNPTDSDGFRQNHASGSLAVRLPNRGELSFSGFASGGVNRWDAGLPLDTRTNKEATVFGARWRQPVNSVWTSTLEFGRSTDDQASLDSGFDSVIATRRNQATWQNDLRLPIGSALVSFERVDEFVTNTSGGLTTSERHTDSAMLGWTGSFADHRVQLNARTDDNSQFGEKTTGSLAYGYQFTPNWRAHLSTGTAFKAPSFNDLYFPLACFPPFGCFGGNPDLKPEFARNREAGIDWERGAQRASLVLFRNRVTDLIVWGNQPSNVGTARLSGATASFEGNAAGWSFGGSLTRLKARDADTGLPLIRRAERQLSAHLERRLGAWQLGAELQALSARDDTDFGPPTRRVRLGGYGLVSAFAHYQLAPDWRVELRGNNLGNKKYEPAVNFGAAGATAFVGLRYAPR